MAELLPIGSHGPDFSLPAADGQTISISHLTARHHVVVVFYVGDNTPDWNRQLSSLRDDVPAFAEMDTVVVGINPSGVEEHARYSQQLALNFPLLSDAGGEVARRYGVLNSDRSVQRSVYIIDKRGLIHFATHGLHWVPEFYNALATLP